MSSKDLDRVPGPSVRARTSCYSWKSWRRCILPILLAFLVFAAYRSTLDAEFVVWDDDDHVYENPNITAVDGYSRGFKDWRDTAFYPLTFTTFYVEWRLADGRPWLFHLDNVIGHAANGVAVGLLARALGLASGVAWATAGIWALHPMQVASVAWITERKNVLYVFFYLMALLAYARTVDADGQRRAAGRAYWLVSLGCGFASLMSKATGVTLPIAVLMLHWAKGRAFDRRFVFRLLPYFFVAVSVGLLHVYREEVTPDLGLPVRMLIAARATLFYVLKFLWPSDLVAMYPRWPVDEATSWGLPPLIGLTVLGALALWQFRRLPRAAWFGIGLFAVNIALVVGIIWFPYMVHSFVADHLVYLASVGLALLLALAGRAFLDWLAVPRPLEMAFVAALWIALAGATKDQTAQWRDTMSLWTQTLAVNPMSTTAHNNLGVALIEAGRREEAQRHFEESLAIDPDDAIAILNLGVLAAGREEWPDAVRYYKKALSYNPTNSYIWGNLGVAAAELGQHERAADFYEHALKFDPDDPTTRTNLGVAYGKLGRSEEELEQHRLALRLNPDFMKAHYNLAMAHSRAGRFPAAIEHFEEANRLIGGDVEILSRLAAVHSESGDPERALELLREAVELAPDNPSAHYDLAMLCSELNREEEAIEHLKIALEIGPKAARGPIHTLLGVLYEESGDHERAIESYRRALALDPEDGEALFNLGVALAADGHPTEAAEAYRQLLALEPDNAEAANNLGAVLYSEGKAEEAIPHFESVLRLKREETDARRNLALALYAAGRAGESVRILESILEHGAAAERADLANLLAWIRATNKEEDVRDAAQAVRLAEGACEATGRKNPYYLDTLAAAYAEAGRFSDAAAAARAALDLLSADSEAVRSEIRGRLALYESGRPYRE